MFIILVKHSWFGIEVILDCFGKPKLFSCEAEAFDYIKEFELDCFQVVELNKNLMSF